MKLFDRFDKAYVINLPERKDRLRLFEDEVKKFDLGNFGIIDGVRIRSTIPNVSDGNLGLIKANIKIFEEAIENNFKTILIMEDDCYFTDEVNRIEEYFKVLPSNWDLLYFGGNHNTHAGVTPPIIINDKVIKLHHTFTTHFTAIKSDKFNRILKFLKSPDAPIDVFYSSLQKTLNVYCFYPAIAKQRTGWSDIENRNINYDYLIR